MLVVQYSRFVEPVEVAELVEMAEPDAPGLGEALIEVERVRINPADLLRLQGLYANTIAAFPAFAGAEGVERVINIDPEGTRIKVGDRVLLALSDASGDLCRVCCSIS